jgi:hypothetical protein
MLNSSNDCSLLACKKVQCISSQHSDVTHIQLKLAPIPPTSPAPCPSPRDIQDYPSASQVINLHFIEQHFVNSVHPYLRERGWGEGTILIFNHKHNRKKKHLLTVPESVCVFRPFTSLQTNYSLWFSHVLWNLQSCHIAPSKLTLVSLTLLGMCPVWTLASTPRNSSWTFRLFKMRPLHCLKSSDHIRQERRPPDLLNTLRGPSF